MQLRPAADFGILPSMRWRFQKGRAWNWAALLLLAIPAATNGYTSGDYSYVVNWPEAYIPEYTGPFHYTITGYSGAGGSVTIPQSFNDTMNWVTKIGAHSFQNQQTLRSVANSYGVESIDQYAFYNCGSLTNVTLPPYGALSSIGAFAFQGTGLRKVEIAEFVEVIGEGAFSGCMSLTAIVVDAYSSYYSSTNGILFNKTNTALVQYPAGKQGVYAISEGVVTVEPFAFFGCRNLSGIAIGDSVRNIGNSGFSGCSGLMGIEIPDGVTAMGNYAFESCVGLTNAWVGNGVSTLYGTFSQCSNLTKAVLGRGITNVSYSTFAYCPALTGAYFSGAAPTLSGTNWFAGATNATVYRLPGAAGWPAVPGLWAGRPTALWLPETKADESLGVQNGRFGFNINWASGQTVVVEACTNLADPVWTPVGTNTFAGDSTTFGDSEWANRPGRFYRLCLP